MSLVNTLLTAGSLVPFVGDIAEVANEFFGSASEFGDKADDVVTAARRVVEVLQLVDLMTKNAASLIEGKDIVEARMRQLLELLQSFHAAVRAFGTRGWFKRMWTIRGHVDSLSELDRDIKLQLEMFRDAYRLATDNVYLERTYALSRPLSGSSPSAVSQPVSPKRRPSRRCQRMRRQSRPSARSCRQEPGSEFHIELRSDVKELLRREESLRKDLMRRDSSLKQRLGSLANSLTKKTQAETVRSLKSDTLAQLEVTLDSVEALRTGRPGRGI